MEKKRMLATGEAAREHHTAASVSLLTVAPAGSNQHPSYRDARLWASPLLAWIITYILTANPTHPATTIAGASIVALDATLMVTTASRRGANRGPRHRRQPAGSPRAALLLALVVSAAASFSSLIHNQMWAASPLPIQCAKSCEITVQIMSQSRQTGAQWRTRTQVKDVTGARQSELTLVTKQPLEQPWGSQLRIKGTVGVPGPPPHLGTMRNPHIQPLPEADSATSYRGTITGIRARWQTYLNTHYTAEKGLLLGMSVGDTALLDPSQRAQLQATSTAHLVAISGTHLALIVTTIDLLLPGRGRSKAALTIFALVAIVTLVGGSASAIRAATMAAVVIGAGQIGRRGQGLTTLSLIVTAWLIIDPWLSRSWGFALSSAATAGVLTALQHLPVHTGESGFKQIGRKAAQLAVVALFAHAYTAPIVYRMNTTTSLWAVPANLAVAPAIAITTLGAVMAMLAATYAPPLTPTLTAIASTGGRWISGVTQIMAELPGAHLTGNAALMGVAANVLAAISVSYWYHQKRK